VLKTIQGNVHTGPSAVKRLFFEASWNSRIPLPLTWGKKSKREKLLWLGKKLPIGWGLFLFQEPRRTRRARSAYWKCARSPMNYRVNFVDPNQIPGGA
jgi:hypothetical protein